VDGNLVGAAQEERFTRVKHDASIPVNAVAALLRAAGLTMADVDHVVFYEKPLRKFERILVSGLAEFPRSLGQVTRAMRTWLSGRLWLRKQLVRTLGCSDEQLMFCEHHLSHAASAFLPSPFEDAAVLTVDGVGEWATTAIHHGRTVNGAPVLETAAEQHHPHSLGLFYSAVTAYLGFEVNEGEFKVMGLAAYGRPTFTGELQRICRVRDDATLEIDLEYVSWHHHATQSFAPRMEDLLGPARRPGAALTLPPRTDEDQRFADIAASLQQLTEEHLLALAARAQALTGARNLCVAGGVALNCVANRRLAKEGPFEQVFVPPAPGDAGGAVGAALWCSQVLLNGPRGTQPHPLFLAPSENASSAEQLLRDLRMPFERFSSEKELLERVAERLAGGEVGALCHGRAEWGPRALGHRSIVADARVKNMKDRINDKVKQREGFRPFAPAALEEDAQRFFEAADGDVLLRPAMLSVARATAAGAEELPAVTHVDGTARLQTVTGDSSPRLHALLHAFKRVTGVGVLLNTSLNLKDQPLCHSHVDACAMMEQANLDFMVLEDCLVTRRAA
jgi:carbamoyltransferase